MKHKQFCNEKDCLNYREIEWNEGFIENWICEECDERIRDPSWMPSEDIIVS